MVDCRHGTPVWMVDGCICLYLCSMLCCSSNVSNVCSSHGTLTFCPWLCTVCTVPHFLVLVVGSPSQNITPLMDGSTYSTSDTYYKGSPCRTQRSRRLPSSSSTSNNKISLMFSSSSNIAITNNVRMMTKIIVIVSIIFPHSLCVCNGPQTLVASLC